MYTGMMASLSNVRLCRMVEMIVCLLVTSFVAGVSPSPADLAETADFKGTAMEFNADREKRSTLDQEWYRYLPRAIRTLSNDQVDAISPGFQRTRPKFIGKRDSAIFNSRSHANGMPRSGYTSFSDLPRLYPESVDPNENSIINDADDVFQDRKRAAAIPGNRRFVGKRIPKFVGKKSSLDAGLRDLVERNIQFGFPEERFPEEQDGDQDDGLLAEVEKKTRKFVGKK